MSLTEVQRQEYLEIMGIQSYFPRYQLPGARVSVKVAEVSKESKVADSIPEHELPVQPVSELEANPSTLELSNPHQHLPESQELGLSAELRVQTLSSIQEKGAELEESSRAHEVHVHNANPVSGETTDDTDRDIRFRLLVFRVSENICILNQVPHIGLNQPLSPQHRALLNKICLTLKLTQAPVEFDQALFFSWPFEVQAKLDNGSVSAQLGIKAYLEQQHSVQAFDTLVVMGEVMSKYCSSTSFPDAKALWKTINTPSLDEMLKAWQFKRDAWKKMRSLEIHL